MGISAMQLKTLPASAAIAVAVGLAQTYFLLFCWAYRRVIYQVVADALLVQVVRVTPHDYRRT